MRTKTEDREVILWSVKEQLLKETGGRCAHCGTPLERYRNLTVDHVIPLNKGGTNDKENLTVLCTDCNKLKSDMILRPMEWYPYLSNTRRKALGDYVTKYIKETDYLAENCLMPVDTFRIEVPITTAKKKGAYERRLCMPAYIQGSRMEMEDAVNWLSDYKRSLLYRDSMSVITSPSEFSSPCYLLKKGNTEVAMINPWMEHKWDDRIKNYRNEIIVDWFFSPKMPDRDYLPKMLAYLVLGVEAYIVKGMGMTMEGASIVMFHFRCFLSDRFCKSVFDMVAPGRSDETLEYDSGYSLTARFRDISIFDIVGSKKASKELAEKLKREHEDGKLSMDEAMNENKTLNDRFEK